MLRGPLTDILRPHDAPLPIQDPMPITPLHPCARPRFLALAGLAALTVVAPPSLTAQVTASERSTLTQMLSGTEVVIDYARPSIRGRTMFGGQIPWGEVWTPGANASTTFHFSKDVTLDGHGVPAGTYGVWMQVLEDEPWVFVLHSDTTLFHTQHPRVDQGFLSFPVEVASGTEFTETLTFDIDSIRADGARIDFRWGLHRVSVTLGVDPGYVLTVDAEEGVRYEGVWSVDNSMSLPPDSVVEEMRAEMPPEQFAEMEAFLASMAEPSELTIRYDPETRHLLGFDATMAAFLEADPSEPAYIFVIKAEGVFLPGWALGGELADLGEYTFWEFEYGPDGRAVRFVARDPDDEVRAVGV
ncbi:MAG TPA: DUF2911 domain-containing protein, partial [Longimicrobiales bacterium]|nr:DUF2911 domain-containing protein [Longimicrobiales bacterium]